MAIEANGGRTRPTILIVEDEPLIAMAAEDMLLELGFDVTGIASSNHAAAEMLEKICPEYALLDINLGTEKVFPTADILHARGTKLIFTSGGDGSDIIGDLCKHPIVPKPYHFGHLEKVLNDLR